MTRSMTAFAREQLDAEWGSAAWELRSVNHRYLDASVRLPEDLRPLETAVRARVTDALGRGKVECALRFQALPGRAGGLGLDLELARQVVDAGKAVAELLPAGSPGLSAEQVLRWPGVIEQAGPDLDVVGEAVLGLLDEALAELVQGREREGEKLGNLVLERCSQIESIVQRVRGRLPEVVEGQRSRLRERLGELREELDEGRVEQEIVLFSQKVDVAEELERLETHVTEVRRVIGGQAGPVGRRLDFLMQELNREANTLGSKSADAETTKASVDLKVLIEQMREQIQNIE